jgi:hypothetical protein
VGEGVRERGRVLFQANWKLKQSPKRVFDREKKKKLEN